MAETERDQVISTLRACLLSLKGGIPVGNLNRDYRMLVGSDIPYQELGYRTLVQFLESIPDVTILRGPGGEMILHAIPAESTEHLAALVNKQKSAKRKHSYKAPPRKIPPRRTAASVWRPASSAVPVRSSRHCPPASTPMPLSVTVKSRPDVERPSEEHSRVVSFALSPSPEPRSTHSPQPAPINNASSDNGGGKHSYQTFEKPPRFLRSLQQENLASSEVAPDPIPDLAPDPAPKWVAHVAPVTYPKVSSAQDRLRQIIPTENSAKKKNFMLNLNGTEAAASRASSNACNVTSPEDRTITSPLTPMQARLNASVRKASKVQVLPPLEEQFAGVSLEGGGDFTKQLACYALSKGISIPVYKVIPQMCLGEPRTYSCAVKIDDLSISSYPDERSTPEEAMNVVAKQALEELRNRSIKIDDSVTQDEHTIMKRISQIVGEHRCGIWSMQIPIDYYKLYNESLPHDWLNIMRRCPLVSLECVDKNRIIVVPNLLASPAESTTPIVKAPAVSMEASRNQQLVSPIELSVPESITLPQEDEWNIYITCGNSTNMIWGRLIGEEYNVKYENLETDMEMFYMGQANVAANPETGSFYAIKVDDCWHRVELVEINETRSKGRVFFIDYGDQEEVLLSQLHTLEQCFRKLPAQAVRCFLWGLVDLAGDPNVAGHIADTIHGKTLVASVKSLPNQKNPAVGIVLYDTSTDDDINMNTVLIESVCKDVVAPHLTPGGKVKEMCISHVTHTGDVFLQFETYKYMHSLICSVTESSVKWNTVVKACNASSPDPSRLYLAQYHKDRNWYRAAITKKFIEQKEVEVIFVDFGNTELINPSDLISLETLRKSVAEFPHQAIKVHLHSVPCSSFSNRMAIRVRELVPFDEHALVKIVSARTPNGIPMVEIFKRIQPDNLLVSINSTLAFDSDLRPPSESDADDGNNLRGKEHWEHLRSLVASTGLKSFRAGASSNNKGVPLRLSPIGLESCDDGSTSEGLRPPQIPSIGDYFDVNVTMAANPSNFMVQPYKDIVLLEKMMEDMQTQYSQQRYSHTSPDSIKEGGLYAAFHDDGHCYRVYVSKVISHNMVSVYFCDFGDFTVLPIDRLQPLTNRFKKLPYQAIKAKLAGVQPRHNDWSVEDCLMFQELVVERAFVSVIMESSPYLLNPTNMIIGLKLIDTSGGEDVYIDQLLINQGRAVMTTVS